MRMQMPFLNGPIPASDPQKYCKIRTASFRKVIYDKTSPLLLPNMPLHKECINNVWPEMKKKQVFVRQFYKGLMILKAGGNGGKILILFIYLLYWRIKKGQ